MYEQLQEFIDKCVKLGWKQRGMNYNIPDFECCDIGLYFIKGDDNTFGEMFSYHELFSKNSGIMEFVEWEKDEHIEKIIIQEHGGFKYDLDWSPYYAMSDMTAEQKIQYFNKHAKLPQQSDK